MSYGIFLAILSSVFIGISLFYQRIALKRMRRFDIIKMLKSRKWLLGLLIGAISFIFYLLALNVEKVALVQPLVNTSIIFSIILGHFLLREKVTKTEIVSIFLVFIGIILMAIK